MITNKDNEIINFCDTFGGITIKQCSKLFYKEAAYKQDLARKRLKKLIDEKYLKGEMDWATNQKVFYISKKPSSHTIMIINYNIELIFLGAEVLEFQKEYQIENICRPDAFIVFKYNNKGKLNFVEVDMSHKTNLKKYLELYNTNKFQSKYGTFPEVVIISSTREYDLKGYPFAIKVLDYNLSAMEEKILKF